MNFIPYRPDWFHSKVYIPELEQLQKECIELFWKTLGNDIPEDSGFYFVKYSINEIPTIQKLLSYYKLNNNWCNIGFSVINNGCKFGGIHYDFINGAEKYLALNIPLMNCEGSYNVWYTGEVGDKIKTSRYNAVADTIVFDGKESVDDVESETTYWTTGDTTELDRVECTTPMLVHVGRPHRPEVTHNKLRVLLTIRFRPELTEEEFQRLVNESY